jgi:hypothetical protein
VIEEFLEGEEASFFAMVDGEKVVPLIAAQVCCESSSEQRRIVPSPILPSSLYVSTLLPSHPLPHPLSHTPCLLRRITRRLGTATLAPTRAAWAPTLQRRC